MGSYEQITDLQHENDRLRKVLTAIVARYEGDFDNPVLEEMGMLRVESSTDCYLWAKEALKS